MSRTYGCCRAGIIVRTAAFVACIAFQPLLAGEQPGDESLGKILQKLGQAAMEPDEERFLELVQAVRQHTGAVQEYRQLYVEIAVKLIHLSQPPDLGGDLKDRLTAKAIELAEMALTIAGESANLDPIARCYALYVLAHDPGDDEVSRQRRAIDVYRATLQLPRDSPHRVELQVAAAHRLWHPLFQRASDRAEQASLSAADERFRLESNKIAKLMAEAELPEAVSALGNLMLAKWRYNHRLLDLAEDLLPAVEQSVEHESIALTFRLEYLNLAALIAIERKNFSTARRFFSSGLDAIEASPVDSQFFRVSQTMLLTGLSGLLLTMGDYLEAGKKAHLVIQRCKDAASQNTLEPEVAEQLAAALMHRAKALEDPDHLGANLPEQRELLHKARCLIESLGGDVDHLQAALEANVGMLHYIAGELDEANGCFQAALNLSANAAADIRQAECWVNQGWVAMVRGETPRAIDLFTDAIEHFITHGSERHPRTSEAMGYLARALEREESHDDARVMLRDAIALRNQVLDDAVRSSLKRDDCLAVAQNLRMHFEAPQWPGVLDTYLELAPQLGIDPGEQYDQVLRWKAVPGRVDLPRLGLDAPESLHEALAELKAVRRELRRALFSHQATETRIGELRRKAGDIEQRLRAGQLGVAPGAVDEAGWQDIRAALPPRSVLVEIVLGRRLVDSDSGPVPQLENVYYAYVVEPHAPVERLELGPAREIDAAVAQFYDACLPYKVDEKPQLRTSGYVRRASEQLQVQLKALLQRIVGRASFVIVVGDGAVHRLPLAALPVDANGKALITLADLVFLPRAHVLLESAPAAGAASAGLVVSNVDYSRLRVKGLGNLKASEGEGDAVVSALTQGFPGIEIRRLQNDAATVSAVESSLVGNRFVHFATHGIFLEPDRSASLMRAQGWESQLDAGVVLAPASELAQQGVVLEELPYRRLADVMLSAAQVAQLNLSSTELVVISACNSALGHAVAGQGVVGFESALDQAGAQACISALWEVSDPATALLMADFYKRFATGDTQASPYASLAATQRAMLSGELSDPEWDLSHPYYWAAFSAGLFTAF